MTSKTSKISIQKLNLFTKDTVYGSSIIPTIHFELLKDEHLSTKNNSVEVTYAVRSVLCAEVALYMCVCEWLDKE